jgi:hypothetical protein
VRICTGELCFYVANLLLLTEELATKGGQLREADS